jgi:hypothetical protein
MFCQKKELLKTIRKNPYLFLTPDKILCFAFSGVNEELSYIEIDLEEEEESTNPARRASIYMSRDMIDTIDQYASDEMELKVNYHKDSRIYELSFDDRVFIEMTASGVKGIE